jgi:hypothetical protein
MKQELDSREATSPRGKVGMEPKNKTKRGSEGKIQSNIIEELRKLRLPLASLARQRGR